MSNKKKATIPEVEKGRYHQIPPKGTILELKAPVVTPEPQEKTDTGATAALVPMRVLDTGALVTILAVMSDQVIKAPAPVHAATSVELIKAPETIEDPVMILIAVSQPTDIGIANHPVDMSQRAMVAV